jgi:ribokinase
MLNYGGERSLADMETSVKLVHRTLVQLRTREGLTAARLRDTRVDYSPILDVDLIKEYGKRNGLSADDAAVAVIRHCVVTALQGTDRIVADVTLNLRALAESYEASDLPANVVAKLYTTDVGERRRTLLANWTRLHSVLRLEAPQVPADRTLRGNLEPSAFMQLARAIHTVQVDTIPAPRTSGTSVLPELEEVAMPQLHASRPKVAVIGCAVMDVIFRIPSMPNPDTSVQVNSFEMHPGGKGLTQAVAAARLGMDVELIAAVGDDYFGKVICEYLTEENVGTNFLKVTQGARTPVTAVITLVDRGDSIALGWKNETEVRLTAQDMNDLADDLAAMDYVLMTFEPPIDTVEHTLTQVLSRADPRPLVIATPAPPYAINLLGGHAISTIDYLVGNSWEIRHFFPNDGEFLDPDALSQRLLINGVDTVFIPVDGKCAVYSKEMGHFVIPAFPSIQRETAGARDAFCAALALQLHESANKLTVDAAMWATAAMAASAADQGVPTSMPSRQLVERLIQRARFQVVPRMEAATEQDTPTES